LVFLGAAFAILIKEMKVEFGYGQELGFERCEEQVLWGGAAWLPLVDRLGPRMMLVNSEVKAVVEYQ
jgi:hypothetical protein